MNKKELVKFLVKITIRVYSKLEVVQGAKTKADWIEHYNNMSLKELQEEYDSLPFEFYQ